MEEKINELQTKLKENNEWVIFKEDDEGLEFLFELTNSCKILSTCYIDSAMKFKSKEIALKMVEVLEAISEKWFNSSVAKVKLELKIEK